MSAATFIVEVAGFEGEDTAIFVSNDRDGGDTLYCVGQLGADNVIRFVDWGYRSVAEAKAAWPEAAHATQG